MAIFPQISPVLDRSSDSITDMILSLPDLLPPEIFGPYREYCSGLQDQPDLAAVPTILQNYCMHALILQARVVQYNDLIFQFGIEILDWQDFQRTDHVQTISHLDAPEPDLPAGLAYIRREFPYADSSMLVDLVVLHPLRRMCANLLDYELQPLLRSYYQNQPAVLSRGIYDQVAIIQRLTRDILRQEINNQRPVTLSHFKFQELHIYLEHTGEHATPELLNGIQIRLHGILKQTDTIYQLSPISYIVVC